MCEYRVHGRKIILEHVRFAPGDHFPEWCARVYLPDPWLCDVAYGDSQRAAVNALMRRATVQAFLMALGESDKNNNQTEGE